MFTQTLFFFGDFQGATGPVPPTPLTIEWTTSYLYVPTEEAETPLSTDYYYNLNIE